MNAPDTSADTAAAPKTTPYWWEDAPLETGSREPPHARCDVVVIGAGYTGLSAAIELARAGKFVQVLEARRPGEGASTRNGGITSGNIRPSRDALVRRFGVHRADAILEEGKEARSDLYTFLDEEGIDCDFALTGRVYGAMKSCDYDKMAYDAEATARALGIEAFTVPRSRQSDWIGTDVYRGVSVRMDIGGLHPAKLHAEMLRIAKTAGATIHAHTPSRGIRPAETGHEVRTDAGVIRASNVLVATNGYSDASDRWLRQRLVSVRSRIIATEPLRPDTMRRLIPRLTMCGDTRRLNYYYRPSPDEKRILFGGRDGTIAGEAQWPTEHLRSQLAYIFPELADARIDHSWYGYVAMNRDLVPRIFARDHRRYATGFCGSGVVWARWAGRKAAWSILGLDRGESAFDFPPPGITPVVGGRAWFMPGVFAWLRLRDRFSSMR